MIAQKALTKRAFFCFFSLSERKKERKRKRTDTKTILFFFFCFFFCPSFEKREK